MNQRTMLKHSINCKICNTLADERECTKYHDGEGEVCQCCIENGDPNKIFSVCICIYCDCAFVPGEDGNELGFCLTCQKDKDFPYDLDKYYKDYDAGKVAFKGFETMDRGLLEAYKK